MSLAEPRCPYCNDPAEFGDGKWSCRRCRAWVKIYPGSPTLKPMGRLAKESLRGLQKRAYVAFNQLWGMVGPANGWPPDPTRKAAYRWLAQEIGIDPRDCHIGFFDEVQTRLVIEICMVVGEKREAA